MPQQPLSSLIYYMGGQGFWFMLTGIQMVLIPAIGLFVLGVDPRGLGLAQAASMTPPILLMLVGGVTSERNDARLVLACAQFLAIAPPLILAFYLWWDVLSFGPYILSIVLMGTLSAFVIPARDTLLTRVADGDIQKTVTMAMMLQFIGMLSGIALVGFSVYIGFVPLVILQCALALICGFLALGLPRRTPAPVAEGSSRLKEIAEGFRIVWEMKDILSVILVMAAIGIFYIGTFIVLLPLITYHMYGGNAGDLSTVQTLFWMGTILVTFLISRAKRIVYRGRFLSVAVFTGVGVLLVISYGIPFWALCGAVFVWGLGAGVSMSLTRMIVQEGAPESHRARVLSIYSLSFMGAAPIGAYTMGELAQNLPLYDVILFPTFGMLGVMAVLLTLTPLWRIKYEGGTRRGGREFGSEKFERKP